MDPIKRFITFAALTWTLLFWVLCMGIPLGSLVFFSPGEIGSHLFETSVLQAVRSTFKQVFWSTGISAALGLPLGLWMGDYLRLHPKSRVSRLLLAPYGVPTLVAGIAWVACLGRSGFLARTGLGLDWIYSMKAVVLAHVFFNAPWIAYWVAQGMREMPEDQFEAAAILGADQWTLFRTIIWPQVQWRFWSTCAQVASLCAMSFALVLVLGGGPPVQTLETEIYSRLRFGLLDFSGAAACAVWELLFTLVPWFLVFYFQTKHSIRNMAGRTKAYLSLFSTKNHFLILNAIVLWTVSVFLILPYFSIFNLETLIALGRIFSDLLGPLQVSVQLAVAASIFSVLTAIAAILSLEWVSSLFSIDTANSLKSSSLAGVMGLLVSIPAGVSALVLGLGVWLAYGKWIDPFSGSFIAMVVIQGTLFFPIAFQILWPVARTRKVSQLESAELMGASVFQAFWWVEWPRWRRPLQGAFAGVAGASLGEIGAVSLFYSEKLVPLPLLVSRWMEHYRFVDAQALSGLLLLFSLVLILASFEVYRET